MPVTDQLPEKVRVKLTIPPEQLHKAKYPQNYGEHFAYQSQVGTVLSGAGKTGMFVHFDRDSEKQPNKYIGCPMAWLEKL